VAAAQAAHGCVHTEFNARAWSMCIAVTAAFMPCRRSAASSFVWPVATAVIAACNRHALLQEENTQLRQRQTVLLGELLALRTELAAVSRRNAMGPSAALVSVAKHAQELANGSAGSSSHHGRPVSHSVEVSSDCCGPADRPQRKCINRFFCAEPVCRSHSRAAWVCDRFATESVPWSQRRLEQRFSIRGLQVSSNQQ